MNAFSDDGRAQILTLLDAVPQLLAQSPQALALSRVWLSAVDDADLVGIAPASLAAAIQQTFVRLQHNPSAGCRIEAASFTDAHGATASALLILNPDMPYLVDSFVMALRKQGIASRAVLNAVLSIKRDVNGMVVQAATAKTGTDPLESYVLCLLNDELDAADMATLMQALHYVAQDTASVFQDAAALAAQMSAVATLAAASSTDEGRETAAFVAWARDGGFEVFGYAFYRAQHGERELSRDQASRIGVLRNPKHTVYDSCLAGIPGEFKTLASRESMLSIVKADTPSTLHRDLYLDFIGVREIDTNGVLIGEHCFIGLFTRAAAAMPLAQLPFARGRIKQVLMLAGVRREGFRAEKFLEILEALPRTEAFEADPHWLADLCSQVVSLYKQPRTSVFVRRDVYARHLNVILYLPRERYSPALVQTVIEVVQTVSGARAVRADTQVGDGPLARIYLIANRARIDPATDSTIRDALIGAVDGWHHALDTLIDAHPRSQDRSALQRLRSALPPSYISATRPDVAFRDLTQLQGTTGTSNVRVRIDLEAVGEASIRLYSRTTGPALSAILPALHNAGIEIEREQSHVITLGAIDYVITCLITDIVSARKLARPGVVNAAQALFEALLNDQAEDGRMNGLSIEAALQLREVQLIRAYASYWRQAGCRFSLRYIADCLRQRPVEVRALVDHFLQRFDPQSTASQRDAASAALTELRNNLTDINHADTETILRSLADLILATLRTSYFQPTQDAQTIIFKFDTTNLSFVPQPRPYRELFVFARRFEGVHLRGGPVARGGLRWSDRMEDYRTEVLGLVKAQMVKNAVIVPVGAKGGFVCKMMPKNAPREVISAEGEAVYRLFIAGLLDLTDNRVGAAVVAPSHTVCYDEADPYLVVAADKGTATFSDIANGIAVARGFWLGDAFASGGSNGYDHKKLGITAKGAWEAVKRHFYEIGHDIGDGSDHTPFTVVGVGDMSGDVFGNGMLLSRQLKLIAAFDHRHIFIDPTPDVTTSFTERQRLFALPRSSWDDYDKSLISAGGGVWARNVRHIDLSEAARSALGITEMQLAPEELLHQILQAPVDLFYNGGIGTYIKASSESHADVRDRANDAIRVDGNALRCKVVAEGGNLGATQNGRIEFALRGGQIFTDAIDNSAGVDCSDHEVNVKIWLDTEVAAGTLTVAERNRALTDITTEIEELVLRDNTLQTHLLTRETQAQIDPLTSDEYASLIAALEHEGALSRALEQLPAAAELARRRQLDEGLTAPELAVVIAHVKNRSKAMLAQQPLVQQPWAAALLAPYFPAALVAHRDPLMHPLANPILATVLANEMINRCGPLMIGQLAHQHQVSEVEVAMAWAQAWVVLQLQKPFAVLDRFALRVPLDIAKEIDRRARAVQHATTVGLLSVPAHQRQGAGMDELMCLFDDSEASPLAALTSAQTGEATDALAGIPAELANAVHLLDAVQSVADFLFAALLVQRPAGMRYATLLQTGLALRHRSGIDHIERALMQAVVTPEQHTLRTHALSSLRATQRDLLRHVLHQWLPRAGADINTAMAVCMTQLRSVSTASMPASTFDQLVLDVWVLADATARIVAQ